MIEKHWNYCRIKESKREYFGDRYFKFNLEDDTVFQLFIGGSIVKKGRSNNVGITVIGKMTFFSNYVAMNYCESIPKEEYEKMFTKMIKVLR